MLQLWKVSDDSTKQQLEIPVVQERSLIRSLEMIYFGIMRKLGFDPINSAVIIGSTCIAIIIATVAKMIVKRKQ